MHRVSTLLILFLFVLFVLFLPSPTTCQAIPNLPSIPVPSPTPAASSSASPSPSPEPIPAATEDSVPPELDPDSDQQQSKPSPSPATTPSPIPSIDPVTAEDRVCRRDPTQPRPILGATQARYALAVLGSAAAVGLASVLYSGVYTWAKKEDHTVWRYLGIVTARVLLYVAVRFSAALVGAITKASPEDSALDASGAFLTWGSAIFTRMYYEGIVMTLAALDILDNEHRWDDKLHEYLNPDKAVASAAETDAENPREQKSYVSAHNDTSCWQRLWECMFGGMLERKLLALIAMVYFGQEIAILVVSVLNLIGSFEVVEDSPFFPNEAGGQCSIDRGDVAFFVLVIVVQSLYALTYQPSLIPLLMVGGFPEEREEENKRQAVLKKIQILMPFIILSVWVASLATHPLLKPHLQLIYITGDLSLFWFVVLAPPSYSSPNYIVNIIYTILAALVGAFLLIRIRRSYIFKGD